MLTPMFVPPRSTVQFWQEVIKPSITRGELAPVMEYVERTWIGESLRHLPFSLLASQRFDLGSPGRNPMFPIELSSQYSATIEGRPRHNNAMESNNSKLQKLIKPNPSAWDFMIGLRAAYRGDFQLLYNVRSSLSISVYLTDRVSRFRTGSMVSSSQEGRRMWTTTSGSFGK
jgi:hypothetical protein